MPTTGAVRECEHTPCWPLTQAQQGLWYAQRLAPANPAFNTAHALWIDGDLDVTALTRAANQAARESEALCLRMQEGPDGPLQYLDAGHVPTLQVVDLTATQDPDAAARAAMTQERLTPTDPTRDRLAVQRLYVLGARRYVWYVRVHHLAVDGYGMALFTQRVCALYAAAADGVDATDQALRELAPVLAEDAAYQTAQKCRDDAAYWHETMAGMPAATGLGGATAPAAHDCRRHIVALTPVQRQRLLQAAQRLGQPWPDMLTAFCGEYCRRMSGQDEAVIGVPFMGRMGSASARVPAMVMNVLPLRVPARPDWDVRDYVTRCARDLTRARKHGRYRGEQLRRDLGLIGGRRRLHGPLVNMQPFYQPPQLGDCDVHVAILSTGPVDDVTIGFRGDGMTRLDLEIEANPDLYDAAAVAAHAERLLTFVLAAGEAETLDAVPLATPAEAERALHAFNDTYRAVTATTLPALLERTMTATPQASAVMFGAHTLSYAELERRSRALAQQLRARGVGRDTRVAVALPRSLELVVALVATLRAGAAYLPLDLDHPDARVQRILQAATPVCALAPAQAASRFGATPVLAPRDWATTADASALPAIVPDDAAYVIYTSGSTGEPKGVVIEHRAIVNRLQWMRSHYAIDASDRILQKTPATFDVSVWEFFLPLLAGATLVVAPPQAHRDPVALAALVREHGITTLHFVPSMLAAFLAAPQAQGLAPRRVFVSGEALDAALRTHFHATLNAQLNNLYGPTEAAVDVSYWPAGPQDTTQPVPIGFPVWNTRLYVLDARLRPLPPGVAGDLYIGGVQLARGYLGRDDLTAERFIADPHVDSGRLYRSGDVARWRADGAVEFLGRSDDQIKLHGLRIELGDIEAAVTAAPGVQRTEVMLREDRPGDQRLVAYVQGGVDAAAVRAHVARHVPDYMVPAHVVRLDDWPLTANGKLDRKALPAPACETGGGRSPATATEQALAPLFAAALGLDAIAVDADFFALGGDSLAAVHLLLAIQREFGCDPGLGAMFATPTVAAIAALLDDDAVQQPDHGLAPLIRLGPTTDATTTQPPLFVVHPAGGIAWCYRELARRLAPEHAVYGLQSPALDATQPLPDSITALAQAYVERIVALRPHGVVHLAGWSVGGIIAQAMAVHLQALGRDVGVVALLDAYPAECWHDEPEPDAVTALRALLAVAGYDPDAHPELRTRASIMAFLRLGDSALGNLPETVLDGVVRAVTDTNRLVRTHRHAAYAGRLLHVRAGHDHADNPQLQSALWQAHATAVDAVTLPYRHAELTGRDASAEIAPLLAERMRTLADEVNNEEQPTCS